MQKNNVQFNYLNVSSDDHPSRFVVDLKEKMMEEEELERKKNKGWKKLHKEIKTCLRLTAQAGKQDFDLVKLKDGVKEKGGSIVRDYKTMTKLILNRSWRLADWQKSNFLYNQNSRIYLEIAAALSVATTFFISKRQEKKRLKSVSRQNYQESWYESAGRIINQLAFFTLFCFIFAVIKRIVAFTYKLCFVIGWLAVFLTRFIYLAVSSLAKLVLAPGVISLGRVAFFAWEKIIAGLEIVKQSSAEKWSQEVSRISEFKQEIREESSHARIIISNEAKKIIPQPKLAYLRGVLVFSLVLFILILPFKAYTYYKSLDSLRGKVLGASEQGVDNLLVGGKSAMELNFSQASKSFSQAGGNFLAAQNELNEINGIIFVLADRIPVGDLRLAAASKNIVSVGQLSAELGSNLSLAMASLLQNDKSQTGSGKNIKEILAAFNLYGSRAIANAEAIKIKLDGIDESILPEEYQEQFITLRQKISSLASGLAEFIDLTEKLEDFLGATTDKRYLLVFQNNAELRASGGFIGSFALVDFRNGKIKNIEVPGGGSYDTEAGLLSKIVAPEPLWLVNPLWHFWDANWWPDWPTSARKLMWFYEKSDGSTVDGVIGFTPTVIEKLLKVIGPIDMTAEYGMTIDAENFWINTQAITEQKPKVKLGEGEKMEPKKIIGDLMGKIMEELPSRLNRENLIPLLEVAEELFSQKHILLYFTDEALENKIRQLDWGGVMRQTSMDYLSVINTNIAGGKSDKKITEVIKHKGEIMPGGAIVNTVVIRRTHNGIKREPFSGVRNVDWMRIYVPEGSELIEATGFQGVDEIYFEKPDPSWQRDEDVGPEAGAKIDPQSGTKIYDELGKTVFANWSQVDPGETIEVVLKYRLPFKLNDLSEQENRSLKDKLIDNLTEIFNPWQRELYPYSLLVQKQPGANLVKINSELIAPDNFKAVWKYPESLEVKVAGWQTEEDLNSDKFWAVLLEN